MGVGQLWAHHTGHDATREYGTVTRRNEMDTVIKLRPLSSTSERLSFALDFEKKRYGDRAPADFETAQINLDHDEWQTSGGAKPTADRVELLEASLTEHRATYEHGTIAEKGLSEVEFSKLLSDDPAGQKSWRERLHAYFGAKPISISAAM